MSITKQNNGSNYWLEIFESEKIKSIKNYPTLLYGDVCEVLPGRRQFNKRSHRIKNFILKLLTVHIILPKLITII